MNRTAAGHCVCSVRPEERGARNKRKEDMGGGERQTLKHPSSLFFPFFFSFCSSPLSDSLEQAKRRQEKCDSSIVTYL